MTAFDTPRIADLMRIAIEHGNDPVVPRAILTALAQAGVTVPTPLLDTAIAGARPTVLALCTFADLLGELDAFELLALLASHRSDDVRQHAATAYARRGLHAHLEFVWAQRDRETSAPIAAAWGEAARQIAGRGADSRGRPPSVAVAALPPEQLRLLTGATFDWRDAKALLRAIDSDSPAIRDLAGAALRTIRRSAVVAVGDALDTNPQRPDAERLWRLLVELDAAAAVERAFEDVERSIPLHDVAIPAIAAAGGPREAALLVRVLERETAGHRWHLENALRAMGDVAYLALLRAFREPGRLRAAEAELLAELGGELAIEPLVDGVLDESSAVIREGCAVALRRLAPAAIDPLGRALRRAGPHARSLILALLAATKEARALRWLLPIDDGRAIEDRQAQLAAVGAFADSRAIEAVLQATRNEHEEIRAAAAGATRHVPDAEFTALALRLLSDPSERVQQQMVQAIVARLKRRGSDQATLLPLLVGRLHPDTLDEIAGRGPLPRAGAGPGEPHGRVSYFREAFSPDPFAPRDPSATLVVPREFSAADAIMGTSRFEAAPANVPPVAQPAVDQTAFCVTAPASSAPGSAALLNVWAYLETQRKTMLRRAREEAAGSELVHRSISGVPVSRGTPLQVRVEIPSLDYEDSDTIHWNGSLANCAFMVPVPKDAAAGAHVGVVRIFVGGLHVARLFFDLRVGPHEGAARDRTLHEDRVATAFASYASQDRERVLARIQGIQKVLPDIDIFIDVISLRSGQDWKQRLATEIGRRDVLYLFWSQHAARSEWVDFEWRTALRDKGLDAIDPVPLDSPEMAATPPELASLHFNDWTLQIRGDHGASTPGP